MKKLNSFEVNSLKKETQSHKVDKNKGRTSAKTPLLLVSYRAEN